MHWLKVVRRKLNIEVVEHVLEEDLKRVIGSAFGVGGFEYSVFEGTPSVHRKTTIQVWRGERILGYVKVTRSEEVGRLFEREASFLKYVNSQQLTDSLSHTERTDNTEFTPSECLSFRCAQEITTTQHNQSKLCSASLNRNFPTDGTDCSDSNSSFSSIRFLTSSNALDGIHGRLMKFTINIKI